MGTGPRANAGQDHPRLRHVCDHVRPCVTVGASTGGMNGRGILVAYRTCPTGRDLHRPDHRGPSREIERCLSECIAASSVVPSTHHPGLPHNAKTTALRKHATHANGSVGTTHTARIESMTTNWFES